MSSSTNSNAKFFTFAVITLVGGALVIAGFAVPRSGSLLKSAANQLVADAQAGDGGASDLDYRLAYLLDSHNQAAAFGLAQARLSRGQDDAALKILDGAGDMPAAIRLKARTLIELGRANDAKPLAAQLASSSTDNDILLAGIIAQQTGDTASLAALNSHMSSPEAVQGLARITAGDLPLAEELRVLGLPVSARALLVKLPDSLVRDTSLGELMLASGTKADLAGGVSYLTAALKLDPSNINARKLLIQLYQAQKDTEAVTQQQALLDRLTSGRP